MSTPRTLLAYQSRWVGDPSGLAVIEKSRRIGISWAEAYHAVMHAGAGNGDVMYQSYSLDMARGFIDDCAEWAKALQMGAAAVGETLIDTGDRNAVQAFRIRMACGKSVTALASSPRAWRSKGRPGDVAIIDEAAFVDDLEAVLTAALATRIWGGRVRIISTHNGEASPFAALVRDIRQGIQPGELHTVTLRTALYEGLYKRICQVTGQPWSAKAEAQWEADLRAEYGARAGEELDCVPSSGSGAWLSWKLIRAAEHGHAGDPGRTGNGPTFIGIDVARRRDLWVAVVLERVGSSLWCRQLIARRDIRFSVQRQIVARTGTPLPAGAHRRRPDRHGRGGRRAVAGRSWPQPRRGCADDRPAPPRCGNRLARGGRGRPAAHSRRSGTAPRPACRARRDRADRRGAPRRRARRHRRPRRPLLGHQHWPARPPPVPAAPSTALSPTSSLRPWAPSPNMGPGRGSHHLDPDLHVGNTMAQLSGFF